MQKTKTKNQTYIRIIKSPQIYKIARKEVPPPYIPTYDPGDPFMTTNFDIQFTREPAELTPDDP